MSRDGSSFRPADEYEEGWIVDEGNIDQYNINPFWKTPAHAVGTDEYFRALVHTHFSTTDDLPIIRNPSERRTSNLYPSLSDGELLPLVSFHGPGGFALAFRKSEALVANYFHHKLQAQMATMLESGFTTEENIFQILETKKRLRECIDKPGMFVWYEPLVKRDEKELLDLRLKDDQSLQEQVAAHRLRDADSYPRNYRPRNYRPRFYSPRGDEEQATKAETSTDIITSKTNVIDKLKKVWRMDFDKWWLDFANFTDKGSHQGEVDDMHRRHAKWKAGFPRRIRGALFAGIALICPMLIMTIYPSYKKTLIVASVSIFLFGLILACSSIEPNDVIGGVGAYAAVQVVFVALVVPPVHQ